MRSLSPEAREERRRLVVRLRKKGLTYEAIAEQTGLTRTGVFDICKRVAVQGAAGLVDKPVGRKLGTGRALTAEQEAQVQKLIRDKTPDQLKMGFALWSRSAVRELIRERFGVKLQVRAVGNYLGRWGFTPQKPIKRAYERRPEAVQKWLDEDYPQIAARAKAKLIEAKEKAKERARIAAERQAAKAAKEAERIAAREAKEKARLEALAAKEAAREAELRARRKPEPPPKPPIKKLEFVDGIQVTGEFDHKFLLGQRELLLEMRAQLTTQANRLEDEANALIEDVEMGDVQFDEEGGEGDTMVVERERDLVLSAQARHEVEEIDAALARIKSGDYGYSIHSGLPIPRERLKAIPWTQESVQERVGGLARR